jgi:four helix bundle protein
LADEVNDEARMKNVEGMTKSEGPRDFERAFWDKKSALVVRETPKGERVYDLEERTARLGEQVIDFARTIPQDAVTSVGANYVEADDAVSKKEFLKSIGTCKKETREVKHFLRMAVRTVPELKPEARELWLEARELHLIFSKIWRSGKMNDDMSSIISTLMQFVIRASSFIRHSSFVIRHCLCHA